MPSTHPLHEVWILGATGRIGSETAKQIFARGNVPVLVGRNKHRLSQLAQQLGTDTPILVITSLEDIVAKIRQSRPALVINTIGPFTETTHAIGVACLPYSHYVDIANDVVSTSTILDLNEKAKAADKTLVTGAGFGVLATESIVLKLCQDTPVAEMVRVDALPSVALQNGTMGEALAATIIDGLPDGGRRYHNGRLIRNHLASQPTKITTPDGRSTVTGSVPFGELIAAQRASKATNVIAASSEVPSSPMIRAILPLASLLLHSKPLRTIAKRQLAAVKFSAKPRPHEFSWGHAQVRWPDGKQAEGWYRTGDAQEATAVILAEVATRIVNGEGQSGAYTPGALFGPELAEAVGGTFIIDKPYSSQLDKKGQ